MLLYLSFLISINFIFIFIFIFIIILISILKFYYILCSGQSLPTRKLWRKPPPWFTEYSLGYLSIGYLSIYLSIDVISVSSCFILSFFSFSQFEWRETIANNVLVKTSQKAIWLPIYIKRHKISPTKRNVLRINTVNGFIFFGTPPETKPNHVDKYWN